MKHKKDITLGVRVEAALEEQIKDLAEKEDRSVSWMIRHLIIEGLKAKGITQRKARRSEPR